MLQSKLLPKTRKEAPKDEVSLNARLLIRAGFIDKLMAGVYTLLPLGLRVMKKIENVIRSEMEIGRRTGASDARSSAERKLAKNGPVGNSGFAFPVHQPLFQN